MSRYLSEEALTALEESYEHDLGLAADAVAEIREWRAARSPIVRIYAFPGCEAPAYQTDGAAGADCRARIDEPVVLLPGRRFKFPLGFAVELPAGWELQVRPRSGLADKYGIAMVNAPGTVDGDYRGEVCATMINLGEWQFTVNPGDRIAQAILAPVGRATWTRVEKLEDLTSTERGANGHGSTGMQ